MLGHVRATACAILLAALASPAAAAPAMFEASFILHAWGNDVSSGAWSPYSANDWTALPLGYDCHQREPYTMNGAPHSRYCPSTQRQQGHPATGVWARSVGTGTPPGIAMQQSDFGVALTLYERGFLPYFPAYVQSFTYATFANAAGSFFAGGGPAAATGTVTRIGSGSRVGSWSIKAGERAFGGAMGLFGRLGVYNGFTLTWRHGTFVGSRSGNIVEVIGRPYKGTVIGTAKGEPTAWQNPYTDTATWHSTTPMGKVLVSTGTLIGSGTLWTTGQVGNFARDGYTSLWRTGYDNRTSGGLGNIQLVTPTLTHWLSPGYDTHRAQIGMLKIQVPEPERFALLALGLGALLALRRWAGHSRSCNG